MTVVCFSSSGISRCVTFLMNYWLLEPLLHIPQVKVEDENTF